MSSFISKFYDPIGFFRKGSRFRESFRKGKGGFPEIILGRHDPEITSLLFENILDLVQGRGKEDILGEAFLFPTKRVAGEAIREGAEAAVPSAFQSEGTSGLVDTIIGEETALKEADIFSEASLLRQERLQEGLGRGLDLFGKQKQLGLARKGQSALGEIFNIATRSSNTKALTGAANAILKGFAKKKSRDNFLELLEKTTTEA
jgi:hypothetical protein